MTVSPSLLPSTTPTLPSSIQNTDTSSIISISQFPNNPRTLLLHQCKTLKDLTQIHAHLIKTRLLLNPRVAEHLLESAAMSIPGSIAYALSIFRAIEEPNSAPYNIMIRAFTSKQNPQEALLLFKRMREDSVEPDKYTFSCILKSCSRLGALREGEQVHALVLKLGFAVHGFVQNTLIHMYASCGKVAIDRQVFDEMPKRGVISWNSMFAGYTNGGEWEEVVKLFYKMRDSGVEFDEVTMISVLTACGRLGLLDLGEWMNAYIEVNGSY